MGSVWCDTHAQHQPQRRAYVRVEDPQRITLSLSVPHPPIHHTRIIAPVHDLSGGGVSFYIYCYRLFWLGEDVHVELCLPGLPPIRAEAEVVRIADTHRSDYPYLAAIQFTQISEEDRTRIIHRVYQRQAEIARLLKRDNG